MGYYAKTKMKKTFKKVLAIALSVAMCASIATVAPSASAAPKAKKITLNKKKLTLEVGSKYKLKVKKATPAKASKKVTWKTSKKAVATVTKKGVVKAKSEGTAKITATSKSNKKVKATCKVTVKGAAPVQSTTPVNQNTPAPTSPVVTQSPNPVATNTPEPTPTRTPKPTATPYVLPEKSLKESTDLFKVGTVVNRDKTLDKNFTQLAAQQFDIVSFENEMKGYSLIDVGASKTATEAGDQGVVACQFDTADEMVQWAIDNGLKVRGHVLFWESSMANAFFYENYDEDAGVLVSKEVLMKRMENYANQVISHFEEKFPGTVIAWDVVNEAINPDITETDENGLHLNNTGNFYQIFGSGEYIKYAFQCANNAVKAAGIDIDLFYNDFNCFQSPKTQYILDLIDYLNEGTEGDDRLIKCMGMEGYVLTYWPSPSEVQSAMQKFVDKGLKVGINELCVRLSPQYSKDGKEVTDEDIVNHAQKCEDMFKVYCNFAKANPDKLTNVSIWALTDRPDLMSEADKDEADRHYDYGVYGTHSGLFTEELREKEAFNKVIAVLEDIK